MSYSRVKNRYQTVAFFVVLAALWGGTYPAVKIGLNDFPPIFYAALRLDLAAIVLLLYVSRSFDYWWPRDRRDWLAVFSGGIFTLGGHSVLQNIGQQTVPSAIAAILGGLIPVLTIGFAKIFLPQDDFGIPELLGISLGFAGIVVVTQPDPANLLVANTIGQVILVLSAAAFALGGVLIQWANAEMPLSPRTAWAMIIGAVLTHVASFASPTESLRFVQLSLGGLLALLYLGIFVSAIGYLMYFHLLPQLGSVELNLVTYGAAMFGTVFSWILFAEQVTSLTIVGFCLILLGFVLLKRKEFYRI
ncbi:DMT family transporter [Natronorubrum aibiense]|uniref:EamA family transporter n=1 Tax=Natronorubrum aibiense TaxID=348826 RepID=A0A5P9P9I3_9EURY|nr:DMT family transporter [Natronorubrum aibiense]QFU84764.1 EamA family transporter [Natronorubrum aibiense]